MSTNARQLSKSDWNWTRGEVRHWGCAWGWRTEQKGVEDPPPSRRLLLRLQKQGERGTRKRTCSRMCLYRRTDSAFGCYFLMLWCIQLVKFIDISTSPAVACWASWVPEIISSYFFTYILATFFSRIPMDGTVEYFVTVPQVCQVPRRYLVVVIVVVVLCCVPFCCTYWVTAPDSPSGPLLSPAPPFSQEALNLGVDNFNFLISTLIFLTSLLWGVLVCSFVSPARAALSAPAAFNVPNSLCSGATPQLAILLEAAVFLSGRKTPAAFSVFPLSPSLFLML